jgi:hypothetical protein
MTMTRRFIVLFMALQGLQSPLARAEDCNCKEAISKLEARIESLEGALRPRTLRTPVGVGPSATAKPVIPEPNIKLAQILSEIRSVPYYRSGKIYGLRLFAVTVGGFFSEAGFVSGDVLFEVDDSTGDQTQILNFIGTLIKCGNHRASVERQGAVQVIEFEAKLPRCIDPESGT